MAGALIKVKGGGRDESEKVCESRQTNVDMVQNVQSEQYQHSFAGFLEGCLVWQPTLDLGGW
jgi:hypothetical protein